jgi:hypothetical protein
MIRKRVPRQLWDYGIGWTAQVMQITSTQAGSLRGECPLQEVTGETVDISECLDFGFYDHVLYNENAGLSTTLIGRWLGVSYRVRGLMSYWVLTKTGSVISGTTVQRVTNLEKETDEFKTSLAEFDAEISRRFKEEDDPRYNGAKTSPGDCSTRISKKSLTRSPTTPTSLKWIGPSPLMSMMTPTSSWNLLFPGMETGSSMLGLPRY